MARIPAFLVLASLVMVSLVTGARPTEASAQATQPELRPEDVEAIRAGPVFTPFTVRPELVNRDEVIQALMMNYPRHLRDAGIGGAVVVWFLVSDTGRVLDSRINRSSGNAQLDDAAIRVASVYRFTPGLDGNGNDPVAVWIQLPITFSVRPPTN